MGQFLEQFFSLTPDRILGVVERALGSTRTLNRATGRTLQLNSMENRVYEIEFDEPLEALHTKDLETAVIRTAAPNRVVAKFYRPGRWSRETILDEHAFLTDLEANEIPAIAPLKLENGSTLDQSEDGIYFAIFPKIRGRILQELDDFKLQQIGRLLARLHNIGAKKRASHRLTLNPANYGLESLRELESKAVITPQLQGRYRSVVQDIVNGAEPLFKNLQNLRLHGDCHLGNVLWQESIPFFLDFDDMLMGPAVQDIWLIVRGRDEHAERQREVLIHSYESMREFDRTTLRLIEPLRALRIIHYSAWIARRWEDPTFKNAFPDFGTYKYWFEELETLNEQLSLMP